MQSTSSKIYKIHEHYDPSRLTNDIALIKTEKFVFNEFVQPICLPPLDIELGGSIVTGKYYLVESEL